MNKLKTLKINHQGVTLVEVVLAMAVLFIIFGFFIKSTSYLRSLLYQQLRNAQLVELNSFNYDVIQTVRNAKYIDESKFLSDRIEIEQYQIKKYGFFDVRAFQEPRRIVYRYDDSQDPPRIVKEIFASTEDDAEIVNRKEF